MQGALHVRRSVAKRVKQLRLLRGWSQEQLAERVGNSAKHISLIERGQANVTIDALAAIAAEFAVDVADLVRNHASAASNLAYTITQEDVDRLEQALGIVRRLKGGRARRTQ
jgi:transcriptional regulator with XRE-family HTH domain